MVKDRAGLPRQPLNHLPDNNSGVSPSRTQYQPPDIPEDTFEPKKSTPAHPLATPVAPPKPKQEEIEGRLKALKNTVLERKLNPTDLRKALAEIANLNKELTALKAKTPAIQDDVSDHTGEKLRKLMAKDQEKFKDFDWTR